MVLQSVVCIPFKLERFVSGGHCLREERIPVKRSCLFSEGAGRSQALLVCLYCVQNAGVL